MRNQVKDVRGGHRAMTSLLADRVVLAEGLESRLLLSTSNPLDVKHGPLAKVGPELISAWKEYQGILQTHGAAAAAGFHPSDKLLHLVGNGIRIEAYTSGDPTNLSSELSAVGASDVQPFQNGASAVVPAGDLSALAALPDLTFARPVWYTTNVGAVTSQGDPAIRGSNGRSQFAIDGTGIKVGVLSDSYNTSGDGNAATDIGTGDLPAGGVQLIQDSANGTDEGRAMLQLIHDTAPGADLAFATANPSQANFANNIKALAAPGVNSKVIVDDVGYFAEPMFQDGVIAQAVDQVVAGGVSYFSAAGNEGNQSYQSAFRQGPFINGVGFTHDFDPGTGVDNTQGFTLAPGKGITLTFQWDQPFASVPGSASCQSDVDIYVLDSSGTIIAGSNANNIGADPVEVFSFSNTGNTTQNYQLQIASFSGVFPGLMKYINYGTQAFTEWNTNSSTVFGHANAASAAAVGAAPYFGTPAFGVTPPQVESYSSLGGTPILFDTAGNRLGSQVNRNEPKFTAPDGGNTTFFFSDDGDADSFPNFYGTSAAAPAAAAVAALMLQLSPTMSPASVYSTLQGTAQDMGTAGYDLTTGSGLIRADAAIASELGITSSVGANYQVTGAPGSRLLSITSGTVTLGKTLSTFYPGISLSVSGAATAVFAVDQSFNNVTLAGNGQINVTGSGGGSDVTPGGGGDTGSTTPTPTPTSTPASQSQSLAAGATGYARDGAYAGTDLSADPTLVVKTGPAGYTRQTFLTFDLSRHAGPIHSAHLRLFGRLTGASPAGVKVSVSAASGSFTKGHLTWNHRPATTGNALATATLTGTQARWYDWDLSAFLKAQKAAGKSIVTLALRGVSPTEAAALFDSGKAGKGPRLVVT